MSERDQVREVYAASAGRLVAQLFGMTGDFAEAQDVVQEAFVRALARPDRLLQVDNPEAWLRTVAMNLARSRHRRRALFDRLVRAGRVTQPEQYAPGMSADHVALVAALQRLPPETRRTVVLHHIADLPVAEVAEAMGCSVEAVKSRLVRGRRALAGHLDDRRTGPAAEPDPPVPARSPRPTPARSLRSAPTPSEKPENRHA
ncbi:SigE family RNA polymerase sigma factor [Micromonospora sp. NPDC049523]|uniref:RNA polymerase sigma factor n=1 Tax=Micromonospora sp. NPDC049523 TaxID=3155921 RepID=UPI00341320A4